MRHTSCLVGSMDGDSSRDRVTQARKMHVARKCWIGWDDRLHPGNNNTWWWMGDGEARRGDDGGESCCSIHGALRILPCTRAQRRELARGVGQYWHGAEYE